MFHADDAFDPRHADQLPPGFFARATREVARDLLGKVVASTVGGVLTAGRIVETEAYLGSDDPGSHAATKGITARNAVMYGPPGSVYIYFTYGNHFMLNLVTEPAGTAGAVLLRALEPVAGIETMRERRRGRADHELANGPGKLAAALGLTLAENGTVLGAGPLVVFEGPLIADKKVGTSGRIGLSSGHELHLRFFVKGSSFVSKGRLGPLALRGRRSSTA